MIKIGEAAVLLGLSGSDTDKGIARNVLNYFRVRSAEVANVKGKPSKVYDQNQVLAIASARKTI